MTSPLTPDQLDEWVLAYLDGELDAEQFAQLADALRTDPAALDRFVELATLDRAAQDTLTHGEQVQTLQQAGHEHAEPALSFDAMIALLGRGSESAQLVHMDAPPYTLRRAKPYLVGGAIAAVLVLAVTLTFVFSGNNTPQGLGFSSNTNKPAESALPILRDQTVATLTAQHNAVWDRKPHEHLRAGQTLTLTAGFAEITTNRGAVAILQAPATIELTDNDNALQLHSGKLVGICETESSKGFLVRTAHLDITDLGTRFGINADSDETEVHVFEGKVQAERVAAVAAAEPVTLVANMSARTTADTDVITSIDHETDRFAALLPTKIELSGTGQGLAVGEVDPNWQIIAIDGKPLDTLQAVRVYDTPGYTRDVPNDPASAQWVGMLPTQHAQPGGWITYRFQTRVTLPESIAPETAQLALSYTADNHLRAILVNGQRIEMDDAMDEGRWTVRDLVIDKHLVAGENTIAFEVENHTLPGTAGASNVALYVRWAWQQPALTP